MNVFLLMILMHYIADFYLQNKEMADNKEKYQFRHITHHACLIGALLIVLYFLNPTKYSIMPNVFLPVIIISLSHFLIDKFKCKVNKYIDSRERKNHLKGYSFIADQLLHILVILLVYLFLFDVTTTDFFRKVLQLFGIIKSGQPSILLINLLLFLLIMLISVTTVSSYLVKNFLGSPPEFQRFNDGKYSVETEFNKGESGLEEEKTKVKQEYNYTILPSNVQEVSRGEFIGILERLLVVMLIVVGAYQGIGFIVAAKSFARFKQLDNRDWAEYFLSGTLISMLLGIICGLAINKIIRVNIVF